MYIVVDHSFCAQNIDKILLDFLNSKYLYRYEIYNLKRPESF